MLYRQCFQLTGAAVMTAFVAGCGGDSEPEGGDASTVDAHMADAGDADADDAHMADAGDADTPDAHMADAGDADTPDAHMADAGDADADDGSIPDDLQYEIGSATAELPPAGGPEHRTDELRCEEGELPIGYMGRSSDQVDRLQLVCGHLANDGSLTRTGTSIAVGGPGGDEFEAVCPADEAIVGIRGRQSDIIDAIGLSCAPVPGYVHDHTGAHPWGSLHGGTEGDAFDHTCPGGMFLREIQTFADGLIEGITGVCVEVRAL